MFLGNKMRLRYVGLVSYFSQILSLLTGIVFVLLVTRNLSVEEFGEWQIATAYLYYGTFASTIIPYWVTRFRARGYLESLSTGLAINMIISIPFLAGLLLLSPIAGEMLGVDPTILVMVSLYIPVSYAFTVLDARAKAVNPAFSAYSTIIYEISKIMIALLFLLTTQLSLLTVIITVLIAMILQTLYLTACSFSELKNKINFKVATNWIKISWIRLYDAIGQTFLYFDIPLLVILTGSDKTVAYYTIVMTFTAIIAYSKSLSIGLYPTLLQEKGGRKEIEEMMRFSLFLAIPSAVGLIALAPNILYVFKPEFSIAENVLRITAIATLLRVMHMIFLSIIGGTEKVDAETTSFRELARSRLFIVSSMPHLRAVITLTLIYLLISYYKSSIRLGDEVYPALLARVADLLTMIALVSYSYHIARKSTSFTIPWGHILKFIASSIPMALLVSFFSPTKIREVLLVVLIGAIVYFAFLYLIDRWFRELLKRMTNPIIQGVRHINR